ncbi:MAG: ATP synthase F1 subunit epsilon [Lachnospiraceae bacterium]
MAENDNLFEVKIVTPDRVLYTGEAELLEFNTIYGEIGVYKRHIPLTTVLAPGSVTIHGAGGSKVAAVHSGFAEILPDRVMMLAEIAEWPEEIDIERAKRAKERAETNLQSKDADTDTVRAEFALRKALTRINVKEI